MQALAFFQFIGTMHILSLENKIINITAVVKHTRCSHPVIQLRRRGPRASEKHLN